MALNPDSVNPKVRVDRPLHHIVISLREAYRQALQHGKPRVRVWVESGNDFVVEINEAIVPSPASSNKAA